MILMLIGVLNLFGMGVGNYVRRGVTTVKPIDDTMFKLQSKNQNMISLREVRGCINWWSPHPPTHPHQIELGWQNTIKLECMQKVKERRKLRPVGCNINIWGHCKTEDIEIPDAAGDRGQHYITLIYITLIYIYNTPIMVHWWKKTNESGRSNFTRTSWALGRRETEAAENECNGIGENI